MSDINVESDLTSVNEQISKLVEELNKINAARDQMIQQVQNLNGVAMYLRGKMEPVNAEGNVPSDDLERVTEYPTETE